MKGFVASPGFEKRVNKRSVGSRINFVVFGTRSGSSAVIWGRWTQNIKWGIKKKDKQ